MSRACRLAWLLMFASVWMLSSPAHAQYRTGTMYQHCANPVTPATSPTGICDQANAQDPNNPAGPFSISGLSSAPTGLGCQRRDHDRPTIAICYENPAVTGQCPQGSTAVGSTAQCQCNAGTTWNGSACVGAPDGCTPTAGSPSVNGPYTSNPGHGTWYSCDTTSAGANANCMMEHTPTMTSRSHSGQWYQSTTVRYTGQRCTGTGTTGGPTNSDNSQTPPPSSPGASAPDTPNNPPPQACPARQCPGTVNGTSVCVPCGQTSTGNTQTQRDGNGNVTGTTTTNTTCEGATCTTTTTNRDGGGATTSTTTTQTTLGQYCAANPGSPNCNGGSSTSPGSGNGAGGEGSDSNFAGTCMAGFACEGDAVQCAMAREQHRRNCTMFESTTEISDIGVAAASGASAPSGHPINSPENVDLSLSSRINQNPLFGSDTCPANVEAVVMGNTITLPFADLCGYLNLIGTAGVMAALLAAAMIVFRQGS